MYPARVYIHIRYIGCGQPEALHVPVHNESTAGADASVEVSKQHNISYLLLAIAFIYTHNDITKIIIMNIIICNN